MRVVLQRAFGAACTVGDDITGGFDGYGLVALVGITHGDTPAIAERMAAKTWELRIFEAELSAAELDLPILVISQFTLYANTRKGRRPSWNAAAPAPISEPLVNAYTTALRNHGARVSTGRFGAHMRISFTNDGPVTIILDSADWTALAT
ncbi:MAG: D-tyrosyl-tRNA(Tyr) deacylase [Propionibacteriaceae bacterium]|jgi:D-tyrosyl-tRNA(Tyr) deacylase|nr:D-tyrosyl-tRNA(Tyr) deacylase [Propionibacteriaceae bacterium]